MSVQSIEAELATLEHKLTVARDEVANHNIAYRRTKQLLTNIETQLITAKEEVSAAEEVVRLFKQHRLLSSIDDDARDSEIRRFRAAVPAAMEKINAQEAVVAKKELASFKQKIEQITNKQNFARQLVEEEYIPETLQE